MTTTLVGTSKAIVVDGGATGRCGSGTVAAVADFIGVPLSGGAPLTVAFSDLSSGSPSSWSWTFGDGATSTAQNPTHTYSSPGSFNVTLRVTTSSGVKSLTRNAYVVVTGVPTCIFDDFERTVSGTWGVSTSGLPWTAPFGYTGSVDVNGTAGTVALAASTDQALEVNASGGPWSTATGWTATIVHKISAMPATGNAQFFWYLNGPLVVSLTLTLDDPTGASNSLVLSDGGNSASVSDFTTFVAGQWFTIKWERDPTGVSRVKLWQDGESEPGSWTISTTAGDPDTPTGVGVDFFNNSSGSLTYYTDLLDFEYAGPCFNGCALYDDFSASYTDEWGPLWTNISFDGSLLVSGGEGIIHIDTGTTASFQENTTPASVYTLANRRIRCKVRFSDVSGPSPTNYEILARIKDVFENTYAMFAVRGSGPNAGPGVFLQDPDSNNPFFSVAISAGVQYEFALDLSYETGTMGFKIWDVGDPEPGSYTGTSSFTAYTPGDLELEVHVDVADYSTYDFKIDDLHFCPIGSGGGGGGGGGGVVTTLTAANTASDFQTACADMSIDTIELDDVDGSFDWEAVEIDVDRTSRPLTVQPASGANPLFVGNGSPSDGIFFFGLNAYTAYVTMTGLEFDGISLKQAGVFELRSSTHCSVTNMTFSNLSQDTGTSGHAAYKSWCGYISTAGGRGHDFLVCDGWTMNAPTISRDVSGIQVASSAVPNGSIHLTNMTLDSYHYAFFGDVPTSDLILNAWTYTNCGHSAGPDSIFFDAVAIDGSYSNIHATSSDPLVNNSTGSMVDGGGNSGI